MPAQTTPEPQRRVRELAAIRLARFGNMPGIERDVGWEPRSVASAIGGRPR